MQQQFQCMLVGIPTNDHDQINVQLYRLYILKYKKIQIYLPLTLNIAS